MEFPPAPLPGVIVQQKSRFALYWALSVAGVFPVPPAHAADTPPPVTIQIPATQAAQLLIGQGKLDDAKRLLETVRGSKPDDPETLFLLGVIAVAQKNYDDAIELFRRILVSQPDAERVRLELARAFYYKGDYDNATIQFRRARAGVVPDNVKANIDTFLAAINRGKTWSFNFSGSLVYDSDENAATSVDQVTIYGLPYVLDSNARQTSGPGIFGDISGEYSPLLSDNLKLRIGADTYRTTYEHSAFDDMATSVYAGPLLLFSGWDIGAIGTGFYRWFGNAPYVNGRGAKLYADFGITSSWQFSFSLGGQYLDYSIIPQQSGPLYSAQAQIGYAISPSSAVQFLTGYNRQYANPAFAYSGYWFGAAYQQDLPFGFSVNLRPSFFITKFEGPYAGFGVTRSDQLVMLGLDILNRRFQYFGVTPRLTYTYTDQISNVPLFKYSRSQVTVGLTRQF